MHGPGTSLGRKIKLHEMRKIFVGFRHSYSKIMRNFHQAYTVSIYLSFLKSEYLYIPNIRSLSYQYHVE